MKGKIEKEVKEKVEKGKRNKNDGRIEKRGMIIRKNSEEEGREKLGIGKKLKKGDGLRIKEKRKKEKREFGEERGKKRKRIDLRKDRKIKRDNKKRWKGNRRIEFFRGGKGWVILIKRIKRIKKGKKKKNKWMFLIDEKMKRCINYERI